MLQRAASNAYSWWWASHIRTKQSKWMEQNLQDMEEKVATTLKLIEGEGDSFAKRAEMYYKSRPELISFIEESYRAYRALAERYDHISSELQNANTTIASVFPDRVQFSMDDDDNDNDNLPRVQKRAPDISRLDIPKVPNVPTKEFKRTLTSSSRKKLLPSKSAKKTSAITAAKSGLSKPEGLEKIGKLQKKILALQTEKEFVKSSYESKLAKYWEIENQIVEVQEKVCGLEDEFGEGMVIEDDEARTLMAVAAINSCQETLAQLEEKQERSAEQAKAENRRIEDARNKLAPKKPSANVDSVQAVEDIGRSDQGVESGTQKIQKIEESGAVEQKIKEKPEVGSNGSLTVTEMAEKIDELVNKVVSLETAVLSQTSLQLRLRTETDELQAQIQNLEDDKATLINEKEGLSIKLTEMEKKLQELLKLNSNVEDHNNDLQTTKACCNLDQLSDNKLKSVKPDEELQHSSKTEEKALIQTNLPNQKEEQEGAVKNPSDGLEKQHRVKLSEDLPTISSEKVEKSSVQAVPQQQIERQEGAVSPSDGLKKLSEDLATNSSEKVEKSSVQAISQQQIEEQERAVNPSDGLKKQHSVKLSEDLATNSSENLEKSSVQALLQKQIEGPVGAVNPSDGLIKQRSVKLSEDLATNSSEKVEKSSVQAVSHQPIEGQEGAVNHGDGNLTEGFEKLHSEKPDEEFKVSGATQKEEKSMVKVGSIKDFNKQEEKLNKGDDPENARNVQTEEVQGINEHDVSATTGNQGKVVSQPHENGEPGELSEKSPDQIIEVKVDKQVSSLPPPSFLSVANHVVAMKQDDEPDWKQLFLNGIENREKVLLTEYTTVLRNYKELKKKLGEGETKTEDSNFQMTMQLKEQKSVNAKKDDEIRSLRRKLSFLQQGFDESNNSDDENAEQKQTQSAEGDVRVKEIDQPQNISPIEENLRMHIDELLEENLDFWLRFSTSFHQIQKFETEVKDLQAEVSNVEKKQKSEGSNYSLKSDARPLYKHLREIQTELTVWMEKSALLKEELQSRFSSLCNIQEDITKALKASAEDDDFNFTSYQAAKFRGEVLNMKQENNKVADELQAGLDHVTNLQIEVERTLALLSEEFGLSASKKSSPELQRSDSKSRVPLRSFIFGVKPKKQKTSFFSCMHPALQRKYNNRRSTLNE